MTLGAARAAFLRDLRARGLADGTLRSYEGVLGGLVAGSPEGPATKLAAIDAATLRAAREEWTCAPTTQTLRLQLLRTFFKFAVEAGWVPASPAASLKPPKRSAAPTLPLTLEEMQALAVAASPKPREFALLLTMRYSGLAIGDAATLRQDALSGGSLQLRRAKTGEFVLAPLPPLVTQALAVAARDDAEYFFWTGRGKRSTASSYWRGRLGAVAADAQVQNFKPHRLRDTFAVELLAAGVSMQDVSSLLGHNSISTTERYYAPWNKTRSDRLTRIVRETHDQDPLLEKLGNGNGPKQVAGAVDAAPAGGPANQLLPRDAAGRSSKV